MYDDTDWVCTGIDANLMSEVQTGTFHIHIVVHVEHRVCSQVRNRLEAIVKASARVLVVTDFHAGTKEVDIRVAAI